MGRSVFSWSTHTFLPIEAPRYLLPKLIYNFPLLFQVCGHYDNAYPRMERAMLSTEMKQAQIFNEFI
jgi:hypothetical protein